MKGRCIGIDYGSIRSGIAISDPEGKIAFPHSVVPTKELKSSLLKLIQDDISCIVFGESKRDEREDNPIMKDVREFVEELKKLINIPIEFQSEYLTTAQAKRIGMEDKRDGGKKNEMTDASAASIMLQSFLDK